MEDNNGMVHSKLWIEEQIEDFMGMRYRVDNVLFSGKSEFQTVDVVETRGHGKMLLNDGLVMLTERDEFVYHDMITHVPLFTHPKPKRVLVIGGGDGGTAREVLRHNEVEFCKMVEIDKMVVDACVAHIPQTAACLTQGDARFELVIDDAVKYVAETKEKYDVIIVDSTDPIGPAQPLFGPKFYNDVFSCLNEDGLVVSQGESPFYNQDMQESMYKVLGQFFPIVTSYNFTNLTYPGGYWSFTFASKKYHPIRDKDEQRVTSSELEFNYYNNDIHNACFVLPQFMRKNLDRYKKDNHAH